MGTANNFHISWLSQEKNLKMCIAWQDSPSLELDRVFRIFGQDRSFYSLKRRKKKTADIRKKKAT